MNASVAKILRSVQVYFPFMQDYKFRVRRGIRNLLNKTHEKDFEALSQLPFSANNLFLDIGSNRGEAIQSILMRRPDAKIIAFEPNSYLTEKVKGIYKNDPRVSVRNVGLGSADGSFELFIPFYNDFMFDGLASFKEERARGWLQGRLYGFNSKRLEIKKLVCQVKRLDDLDLAPYFIKIDVQGFEYDVLLGAKNTLIKNKPILLIETPAQDERDFLHSLGYETFIYKNSKFVPGTEGLNVFFLPEETRRSLSNSAKTNLHSSVPAI